MLHKPSLSFCSHFFYPEEGRPEGGTNLPYLRAWKSKSFKRHECRSCKLWKSWHHSSCPPRCTELDHSWAGIGKSVNYQELSHRSVRHLSCLLDVVINRTLYVWQLPRTEKLLVAATAGGCSRHPTAVGFRLQRCLGGAGSPAVLGAALGFLLQ